MLGELGYFPRREGVPQCTSRRRKCVGFHSTRKAGFPLARWRRIGEHHACGTGDTAHLISPRQVKLSGPWPLNMVAFRGLPAAKELPQRGSLLKGAFLSSAVPCFPSHAPLPGTQPPSIRRRRLVSPVSVAHFTDPQVPAQAGATNPRPSTRLAAMGY